MAAQPLNPLSTTAGKILSDFLVGKKLRHRNQHSREVVLEIEKAAIDHHSQDDEPATRENDWWPKSTSWTEFTIQFVDGSRKQFGFTDKLDIVEDSTPREAPKGGMVCA